jgi:hypothetical protein
MEESTGFFIACPKGTISTSVMDFEAKTRAEARKEAAAAAAAAEPKKKAPAKKKGKKAAQKAQKPAAAKKSAAPRRPRPAGVQRMWGSKYQVFWGSAQQTRSGLTKDALTINKRGKVVSKKASAAVRARKASGPIAAVMRAAGRR